MIQPKIEYTDVIRITYSLVRNGHWFHFALLISDRRRAEGREKISGDPYDEGAGRKVNQPCRADTNGIGVYFHSR